MRLRLLGVSKNYDVDFTRDGTWRALTIIAGRTSTGKTSVLRFIDYVFGDGSYPRTSEVSRQVRSAMVEVMTPDGLFTLERALGAKDVMVYPSGFDEIQPVAGERKVVDPSSDPASISQWLLATVSLQDVKLKEAPTQDESGVDQLSFRDLMWTVLYLNERVGSPGFLWAGQFMKELKLRQVVDVIFDVYDNEQADLARRIKTANEQLQTQRSALTLLEEFVEQQQPASLDALELERSDLDRQLANVSIEIAEVSRRERAASNFAQELRRRHGQLSENAAQADALLRDRRSLVNRFASLRAQYADDVRKLTLLVEAGAAFDQLSVTVCPACLNPLPSPPTIEAGVCTLCHQHIPSTGTPEERLASVATELRAAKRRHAELDDYWNGIVAGLPELERRRSLASEAEREAAEALDDATKNATSPYVGQRDELQRQRQALLILRNGTENGIKLLTGLEARRNQVDQLERNLERLREQQRGSRYRPDRAVVVSAMSKRFGEILDALQYPKLHEPGVLPPHLDDRLNPLVRGESMREASSGGQVLITLAWALTLFELSIEQNAAHPGFLMIDSPQKNLGGKAEDAEFADIHFVERLYEHVLGWLYGQGKGAQVIFVDNTPPEAADDHVVARYTRDPGNPPFGLIDNEVDAGPATAAD